MQDRNQLRIFKGHVEKSIFKTIDRVEKVFSAIANFLVKHLAKIGKGKKTLSKEILECCLYVKRGISDLSRLPLTTISNST